MVIFTVEAKNRKKKPQQNLCVFELQELVPESTYSAMNYSIGYSPGTVPGNVMSTIIILHHHRNL